MRNLPDIQIGDRLFSELSPNDQDCLFLAANILVEWIIQETENKNKEGSIENNLEFTFREDFSL